MIRGDTANFKIFPPSVSSGYKFLCTSIICKYDNVFAKNTNKLIIK